MQQVLCIFFLLVPLQLFSPVYDVAQEKLEVFSTFGGGVLFVDSKVFIALCRPMSIHC